MNIGKIFWIALPPLPFFLMALFVMQDWRASTVFFMLPLYFLIVAKGRVLFAQALLVLAASSLLLPLGVIENFFLAEGIFILGALIPAKREKIFRPPLDPSSAADPNLNPYSTRGRGLGAA